MAVFALWASGWRNGAEWGGKKRANLSGKRGKMGMGGDRSAFCCWCRGCTPVSDCHTCVTHVSWPCTRLLDCHMCLHPHTRVPSCLICAVCLGLARTSQIVTRVPCVSWPCTRISDCNMCHVCHTSWPCTCIPDCNMCPDPTSMS